MTLYSMAQTLPTLESGPLHNYSLANLAGTISNFYCEMVMRLKGPPPVHVDIQGLIQVCVDVKTRCSEYSLISCNSFSMNMVD